MKRALRMSIALLLALAMIFEYAPVSAFADFGSPEPKEEKSAEVFSVLYEAESLREPTVKHFAMSDGTYTAVQYPYAVHYSEDGLYLDYDNTPKYDEATSSYRIENGKERLSFTSNSTNDLFAAVYGDAAVSFYLLAEKSAYEPEISFPEPEEFIPSALISNLTYREILPEVSLFRDIPL